MILIFLIYLIKLNSNIKRKGYKKKTEKKDMSQVKGCYYCMLFTSIIVFIGCVVPLSDYNDYKENICNITRIEYPTQLPTENNTEGWTKCDCGRYCMAWTTCIKLYSSVKPDLVIMDEYDRNEECTFVDDKCPDGENLMYATGKLTEVPGIIDEYYNNEVTCYYDNNIKTIFLEKDYSDLLIILPSIFVGIMVIIGICICYYERKNTSNNSKVVAVEEVIINDKFVREV